MHEEPWWYKHSQKSQKMKIVEERAIDLSSRKVNQLLENNLAEWLNIFFHLDERASKDAMYRSI